MIHYDQWSYSRKEWMLETGKVAAEIFLLGILFFRSLWGVIFLIPYGLWKWKGRKEEKGKELKHQLRLDFKEVMVSVAFSLQAGYTLEQAISIARRDLERMDADAVYMREELSWMEKRMQLGESAELLFQDLARRSGLEEIESYGEVLSVARKQGGNLVRISKEAAEHISGSIQVQAEIAQVLAGKKLEKKIMLVMPYFILCYLSLTNPSYLQPLYEGIFGRVWMAICLLLIFVARYLADRIVDIAL